MILQNVRTRGAMLTTNARALRFAFAALITVASAAHAAQFATGCGPLPFKAIAKGRAIDKTCGRDGVFDTPEHRAQNRAKNNFCATGAPLTVSFAQFVDLQGAAETSGVVFGARNRLPQDRSVLANLLDDGLGGQLGEGRKVRIAAYVVDAKNSNTSKGESVNCNLKKAPNNDIHISLGQHPDDDLCDTVTAEITPHYRPDTWTRDNLHALGARPIRISGQLFFDASHKPCSNGQGAAPQRVSIWEIHPVYAIDVCRNRKLSSCDPSDDSKWETLDAWADRQADPDEH